MKYFKDFQVFDSETQLPQIQKAQDGTKYYKDFDIQAKIVNLDKITNESAKIIFQDLSGMKFESKFNLDKFCI